MEKISVKLTLTQIMIFCCFVLVLFCPLSAEATPGSHSESEESTLAKDGFDSPSPEPILSRLSSSFSITQIIKETPFVFEIQPFQQEDASHDLNTDIQLPRSIKSNRFEQAAYTTSLVTLAALNIADAITTMQALKHDGLTEGNPMMKPFVNNPYLLTGVKLGVTVFNHYLLKNLHKKNKPLAWVLSMTANLVMSYVVANNIQMIQNARSR